MARRIRAFAGAVLNGVSIAVGIVAAPALFVVSAILTHDPILSEFVAIGIPLVVTLLIAAMLPSPRRAFGNLVFWVAFAVLSPVVSLVAYSLSFWTLDEAIYLAGLTPGLVVWLQSVAMVNLYVAVLIDRRASRRPSFRKAEEEM